MNLHVAFFFQIEPAPIAQISFRRPKRGAEDSEEISSSVTKKKIPPLNKAEEEDFFCKLKDILPSSAILSMVYPTTNTSSTPLVRKLPIPLTNLMDKKYQKMTDAELATACTKLFPDCLKITDDEVQYLEESTKLQSQCLLWFKYRIGRITASKFAAVQKARSPPPMSLIKQIMGETSFDSSKVPALNWGITNEPNACKDYIEKANREHEGFSFQPAGLFINKIMPHLGASPDGLVSCRCCGDGLIEIKCPFKHRYKNPVIVTDKQFCLQPSSSGEMRLSQKHNYYTQIQGQLAICNKDYSDFICWTPHGMHVERIIRDSAYFDSVRPSLDKFFMNVLLPRLLRGNTTGHCENDSSAANTTDATHTTKKFCWCEEEEYGKMVACDNKSCTREWFHFECVGLSRKPRGNWYCSNKCKSEA